MELLNLYLYGVFLINITENMIKAKTILINNTN